MNWLDIVLLLILAASIVTSFRKGFSREVIGLVSVVLALVLGIWFYGTAGALFATVPEFAAAANFAGFVVVFCGVLLLGALVSCDRRQVSEGDGTFDFRSPVGRGLRPGAWIADRSGIGDGDHGIFAQRAAARRRW